MGGLRLLWLAAVWPPVLGSALDGRGDEHFSSREMVHRQLFPIKNQPSDVDEVLPLRRAPCKVSTHLLPCQFPPEAYYCLIKFIFLAIKKKEEHPSYSSKGVKPRNEDILT